MTNGSIVVDVRSLKVMTGLDANLQEVHLANGRCGSTLMMASGSRLFLSYKTAWVNTPGVHLTIPADIIKALDHRQKLCRIAYVCKPGASGSGYTCTLGQSTWESAPAEQLRERLPKVDHHQTVEGDAVLLRRDVVRMCMTIACLMPAAEDLSVEIQSRGADVPARIQTVPQTAFTGSISPAAPELNLDGQETTLRVSAEDQKMTINVTAPSDPSAADDAVEAIASAILPKLH